MAALDFPSSPSVGQTYIANGSVWEWDGTAWRVIRDIDTSPLTYGGIVLGTTTATGVFTNPSFTSDRPALGKASGVLPVGSGGTGTQSLTANAVLIGTGGLPVRTISPGTSGNILTSDGTNWTSVAAPPGSLGYSGQVFTDNGTFTIPTGITKLKVTLIGGGGGSTGSGTSPGSGTAGGNSTVASGTQSITTLTAGGGSSGGGGGSGGTATNGDININGSSGSSVVSAPGQSIFYPGYGNGGALNNAGSGGGGGASVIKYLTDLTPGNTLVVTIGSGGAGGAAGCGGSAGASGSAGIVIFEW